MSAFDDCNGYRSNASSRDCKDPTLQSLCRMCGTKLLPHITLEETPVQLGKLMS